MTWKTIVTLMVVGIIAIGFQWGQWKKAPLKEKAGYASIVVLSLILAALLIAVPSMQGPSQLLGALFQPLSRLLE